MSGNNSLEKKLMLNLGSGDKRLKNYVNIDSRKECNPDVVCDIRKLPYEDNSVDRILASDILEHIGRLEVEKTLREWYRVLKPGGILIIKTPNVDTIIDAYQVKKIPFEELVRKLFGNQMYVEDTHKTGFNPENIKKTLSSIGFKIFKIEEIMTGNDWSNMAIRCQK
jgi:predicted SAM-dependent methyltransferase